MTATKHFQEATLKLDGLTTIDLAYLAGIIDGEGSISRTPIKDVFRCSVIVYNTDKALMDWLGSFGGRCYIRKFAPGSYSTKLTQYGWHVQKARDVILLLSALIPCLRIKKARAQQALDDTWLRVSI